MGKIDGLILKVSLGLFATANFVACIITTEPQVLVPLNVAVAVVCLCIFLFLESRVSGLARELAMSKKEARKLIGDYFDYYKNVERISIDEYLERSLPGGNAGDE